VDTEVFDVLVKETGRTKSELHDWAKSENELNEICTAEEIAGPILFLASDASSFISGVHIPIAGAAQVPAHARMHDACMHACLSDCHSGHTRQLQTSLLQAADAVLDLGTYTCLRTQLAPCAIWAVHLAPNTLTSSMAAQSDVP
jgi:hypothetical protein